MSTRVLAVAGIVLAASAGCGSSGSSSGNGSLFKLVKTVQVMPDPTLPNYGDSGLGYIHYVPATGRFVVMITTRLNQPEGGCVGQGVAFKEYLTDMTSTGHSAIISCAAADVTSLVIGTDLYLASMTAGPLGPDGKPLWVGSRLELFDAVSWQRLGSVDTVLDYPREQDAGPQAWAVNGLIDLTGQYLPSGTPTDSSGSGSHHHFFTMDLAPVGTEMILNPPNYPRHFPELSMFQMSSGDILMLASNGYPVGDMIMLKLDKTFGYIEQRTLRKQAVFPTGLATDGERFFVAYLDVSTADATGQNPNLGVTAYDAGWSALDEVAVSNSDKTKQPDSPWAMWHDHRLYVSYVVLPKDPSTGKASGLGQVFVNTYEID